MFTIPLTKACPECQEEMELITTDDVGEVLVYECPECGYQEETRIETEDEELDGVQYPDPSTLLDNVEEPEAERELDEVPEEVE